MAGGEPGAVCPGTAAPPALPRPPRRREVPRPEPLARDRSPGRPDVGVAPHVEASATDARRPSSSTATRGSHPTSARSPRCGPGAGHRRATAAGALRAPDAGARGSGPGPPSGVPRSPVVPDCRRPPPEVGLTRDDDAAGRAGGPAVVTVVRGARAAAGTEREGRAREVGGPPPGGDILAGRAAPAAAPSGRCGPRCPRSQAGTGPPLVTRRQGMPRSSYSRVGW